MRISLSAGATLAGVLIMAALAEALTEFLIAPWLKPEGRQVAEWRTMALRYVGAAVGVVLAVAYRLDLLAMFGLGSDWPFIGSVLTGLLLGRGANFINDFVERWLRPMSRE